MTTPPKKKQRQAAAKRKYRAQRLDIPFLRAEVNALLAQAKLIRPDLVLPEEPVRDRPPPGLNKDERNLFMCRALERHNRALYIWLREQCAMLRAELIQTVIIDSEIIDLLNAG